MSKAKHKTQDDFESELEFHRREWRVQRIGWGLMALLIALALAGLFGDGYLSNARAGDERSGRIEYQRYTRREAPSELTIHPAASALQGGTLRVAVPASYLQAFKIETITPSPRSSTVEADRVVYEFAAAAGDGASVRFYVQPQELGSHAARFEVGRAVIVIRQFTYP